ncbi:MAG TPA: carbon-nitrogen hydrolase family protein [Tissierellia bacterium]|jgi:predicted amidohydrolase|nr:carbon-nitrogen hydrolase family protein [Tissierellia bacterium]
MMKFKVALIQSKVSMDKQKNIENAVDFIKLVSNEGADLAVFPEMFNCPYDTSYFREYGEEEGGYCFEKMREAAREAGIYVVAGSMPELDGDHVYNTSYVFDRKGEKIAKHRKMHLFDIDVKGGQYFKESDVLSPGNKVTVFNTEFCKIGLAICYDIRFPELSRLMVLEGAEVLVYPAAFNMTTGPAHWELTFRGRALDNQVYTIGVAPARDMESSYHSFGNSIIVSPWGKVVNKMDEKEGYLVEEIDLDYVKKVRNELPLIKHLRKDIYELSKL